MDVNRKTRQKKEGNRYGYKQNVWELPKHSYFCTSNRLAKALLHQKNEHWASSNAHRGSTPLNFSSYIDRNIFRLAEPWARLESNEPIVSFHWWAEIRRKSMIGRPSESLFQSLGYLWIPRRTSPAPSSRLLPRWTKKNQKKIKESTKFRRRNVFFHSPAEETMREDRTKRSREKSRRKRRRRRRRVGGGGRGLDQSSSCQRKIKLN